MSPTNDIAFMPNAAHDPVEATIAPPMVGPTASPMFIATPFKVIVCRASDFWTKLRKTPKVDGMLIAAPMPSKKVNANNIDEVVIPVRVSPASIAATTSMKYCITRRSLRRSNISANAPAGKASKKIDKLVIAGNRATIIVDGVSDVINHIAPTLCSDVPMFDATIANHNILKAL